jgi:subtilase family serine protease
MQNPPTSVNPGDAFDVASTTKNFGPGAAGPSTTRYYLSLDTAKGAGDVLLTPGRAVPALSAGAQSWGTFTVTIPGSTSAGTYYLLACADDTGVIAENNEGNNCRASGSTVQASGAEPPDLRVPAMRDPPASLNPGDSFDTADTTKNFGLGAAGPSTTRYYLSLDTAKGAGDVLLTPGRAVPALSAGAQSWGTFTVTIPGSTSAGTYYLLACADDTGVIAENNEGNNCRASGTTVQVAP